MRKILTGLLVLGLLYPGSSAWGEARVENVRALQRERSRMVDVWYDLVSADGGVFEVSLRIAGGGDEPPLSTVGGDIGGDIEPGRNKHIEWNAGADWLGHLQENFIATVMAERMEEDTGASKGMVRIPGGTNSGNDPAFGAYSLTVESFYMDKTEVTYAHWKRVYDWAVTHGYSFDNAGSGKGANHPVHTVNWFDCVKWCNARSEMEGRTPVYRIGNTVYRIGLAWDSLTVDLYGNGYRLPTATEWEYAARGGLHGCAFPWGGNTISHARANYCGELIIEEFGELSEGYHPRYCDGTLPYTAPVGSFSANPYGLYDIVGNVCEWVSTTWDSDVSTPYVSNGGGIRGGSWATGGDNQCGNDIPWAYSSDAEDYIGFRAVRHR